MIRYHNYPDSAEGIQLELSSECDDLTLPKLATFVPPKLQKSDLKGGMIKYRLWPLQVYR